MDLGQGAGRQLTKVLPEGSHRLDVAAGAWVHLWHGEEGLTVCCQARLAA